MAGSGAPGTNGDHHVLDDPVWHSLTGAHRPFGCFRPAAARFEGDVAPFAALRPPPGPDAWDDLAALTGPGGTVALPMASPVAVPDSWSELVHMEVLQLVATSVRGQHADGAVELGAADVGAMLDLVGRTRPGPFRPRTIELGRYIGFRQDGELVAMAGERMRPAGYTEISAVCTDPAHLGEGLATALVLDLVRTITARGEVPFLHVLADNHRAVALYEHLGFWHRRTIDIVLLQAPGGD